MELCFYSHEENCIIDMAHEINGVVVSHINKQTLCQMQERYADAEILPITLAIERKGNKHKTEPAETTEENFLYFLEDLLGSEPAKEQPTSAPQAPVKRVPRSKPTQFTMFDEKPEQYSLL